MLYYVLCYEFEVNVRIPSYRFQIQRRHHHNQESLSQKQDVIDEVKNAFELAERSSPGITDQFVHDIIHKLLPNMSEPRINNVLDKITR